MSAPPAPFSARYPESLDDPLPLLPYRSGVAPARPAKRIAKLASFRAREIAALGVVALGFDTWTWRANFGGYGAALLGVSLVAAIALASRSRTSVWLSLPFALLAALASLRLAYEPGLLSFVVLASSVLAFAVARRGGSVRVADLSRSALLLVPILRSRIPAVFRGASRSAAKSPLADRKHLLPALVPLALVSVFAGVFALANPVVASGLGHTFAFVSNLLCLPNPARIALFVVAMIGASALIRPALVRRSTRSLALSREGEASDVLLATARNSLVLLNLAFLAYNALDAAYLWAGSPPPGVTTQIYAHQGAFWLTVALLFVTVVLGVLFRGPLAFDPRAQLSRRLAAFWIAQSGILAVGTFLRLAMHVRTSGMSDLRFVGALGTALVTIGLAFVALKIRRHLSFRWLVQGQLTAFAGAIALYALVPTHLLAATYNVSHILAGQYGPLVHLRAEASEAESATLYIPLLQHPDLRVREGAAALLLREADRLKQRPETPAMESSYARLETSKRLEAVRPQIEEALTGICGANAEIALTQLVQETSDGQAVPTFDLSPAAAQGPCRDRRMD